MTTNNEYYKTIYEKVTGETVTGTHTDNFYLNGIAESLCQTVYSDTKCNGKYLKDIAEAVCDKSYSGIHFNNFYLHEWAEQVTGEDLPVSFDNEFLEIIAENIALTTTLTIVANPNPVTYGQTITLTATLLDETRTPISGETVTFYEGGTSLGSDATGSDGKAEVTSSSLSVGTHTIHAVYGGITSSNITVTVNKITPTISLSATDDSVVYGEDIELSGVLSVGSGETVKLYDGSTLVDDNITTSSGGAISKIIQNASVGNHSYTVVYEGDTTYNNVTSTAVSVSVSKKPTELEINVPLVLVYDDSFSITGNLSDGTNAISGATVGLKVGDTVVESDTSDSNGDVSFTQTPVTMGTHTFQLVYAGDEHYLEASSTAVQRNITKETTVLSNVVPSTSSTTMLISDDLTVSGVLTDNDSPNANPIANASIIVTENNNTITTLTTGNDGSFSGTISGATLGGGTHSLEIRYPETTNYATTYTTKEVIVSLGTLSFSASPSILSYADNDSSTLTATLTSGGTGVTGQTVVFEDTNATPILENVTVTSPPDTTVYDIGSKWKLIASGSSSGSQIDMYASSGNDYIRVSPNSSGYTISSNGVLTTLTGSELYYDNGLFYTDSGDSLDTSNFIIISKIKFLVYVTVDELSPILGVDVTDSSGVATGSYASAGVGDVSVQASVLGSSLTKTFVVQDCSLYRANPSACTSCNIDLPSSALVSYKMSKPVIDSTSGGINIQLIDSSHTYFVGNWASNGRNGILIRNTGSSTNLVNQTCTDIVANTEYTLGVTYDNGDWTYFKDNEVKSFSANYTPTKINIIQIQQGTIKDLIIKPL